MDKERLKLIVKNLESLVECLKSEVYSDVEAYKPRPDEYEEIARYITDYDEVFDDDDDDEDMTYNKYKNKYLLSNDDDGDGL